MRKRVSDNKNEVSLSPQGDFGLGSTGCLTARCARATRFERLKRILRISEPVVFQREIEKLYVELYADSEPPAEEIFDAAFAGESDLKLAVPRQYASLASHSGRTLIDRSTTPPFEHLQRWGVPLSEIADKSAQCEAEGVRLYGTANILANVQSVWQLLSRAVKQTANVRNSPEWLRLRSRGISLDGRRRVFNLYFSSAGGQATGAVVVMLGLLYLLIEEDRQNCSVRLHFLLPGFYPARNEEELRDHSMKTQSVIRDLHQLRQRGTTLHIPFPKTDKRIEDTTELFDEIFMYPPIASNSKDRYKTFVRGVSDLVVDMELGPYARGLRSMRSNSAAATRVMDQAQKMFA